MGPATAPCRTRKATNDSRDQANPHSHDETTNNNTDRTNSRTCPKRWVSQPVKGTVMALATANEVITQVPCVALTPRSPAIVGIETLAIEESSTFMKTAEANAMEIGMAQVWNQVTNAHIVSRLLMEK